MLLKKLHFKPGMKFAVVDAPDGFARMLGKLPAGLTQAKSLTNDLDLVMVFASNQRALSKRFPKAIAALKPEGALWVSYPKKSSGIRTDLGMGEWEIAKGTGWNPVAMVAIDDVWSSVRFRHAPGLERVRDERQEEIVRDADGTVCIDRQRRVVTPPADLHALLQRNARASAAFVALSFTHQREYVAWIIGAKRAETRAKRLATTMDMLAKGKKNPADK